VQVACENPAKTSGLWGLKGSLLPGFDADIALVDLSREVKVNKGHINTRSGWSLMEGHTFTGWPVKTILRGKVTAEWAKGSPGMRPVGEPGGHYLRRKLGASEPGSMEVASRVRVSRTDRWLADPYDRTGFSPETLKYTKPRGQ
jgi:dihydropyrimidinase/dihydroorotase